MRRQGKQQAHRQKGGSYLHEKAETEKFTLLAVQIETGRFHQIRAQLSHAGFPILGDENTVRRKVRNFPGKRKSVSRRFVPLP